MKKRILGYYCLLLILSQFFFSIPILLASDGIIVNPSSGSPGSVITVTISNWVSPEPPWQPVFLEREKGDYSFAMVPVSDESGPNEWTKVGSSIKRSFWVPPAAVEGAHMIRFGNLETSFTVTKKDSTIEPSKEEKVDVKVSFLDPENFPFTIMVEVTKEGKPFHDASVDIVILGDLADCYDGIKINLDGSIRSGVTDLSQYRFANGWMPHDVLRVINAGKTDYEGKYYFNLIAFQQAQFEYWDASSGKKTLRLTGMPKEDLGLNPYTFARTLDKNAKEGKGLSLQLVAHVKYTKNDGKPGFAWSSLSHTYNYIAKVTLLKMFGTNTYVKLIRGEKTRTLALGDKLLPNDIIRINRNLDEVKVKWIWGKVGRFWPTDRENLGDEEADILIQPTFDEQTRRKFESVFWKTTGHTTGSSVVGWVLGYVATKGVSAYIYTLSAAAVGWITFGIGLLVGIVWGTYTLVTSSSTTKYDVVLSQSIFSIEHDEVAKVYLHEGSVDVYNDNLDLLASLEEGELFIFGSEGVIDTPKPINLEELSSEILEAVSEPLTDNYAENLVAYYPFDGELKDKSGNNNHGVAQGNIEFSEGVENEAAYFDGDSWITVPDDDSLDLYDSFTFSYWLKKEDAGEGGWAIILSKSNSSELNDNSPYAVAHSSDGYYPLIRLTQNDVYQSISSSSWTGFGEWHHLAITWDGEEIKFFKNGEYQDSSFWEGVLPDSQSHLEIGRDEPGWIETYRGWLDELRIYDTALSAMQVANIYSNQIGTEVTETDSDELDEDIDTSIQSSLVSDTLVYVNDYNREEGKTVSIPVFIKNAVNVGNMDFYIEYDSNVLEIDSYTKGSLTENSLLEANIMDNEILVAFTDTDGISGDGSLVYIKFTVVGSEGDSCNIVPNIIEANEVESYDPIIIFSESGSFSVEDERTGIKGDANGDGRLTGVDALMALQMAVEIIPDDLICDMNDDGIITSIDAAMIREGALRE
jgi:hypothetical protein